jgi:ABC-type multidrug transport system fused ATPase/permease subunit
MVASRSSTIVLADVVVYLVDGRVAAVGDHAHLLATYPGYARLVQAYEARQATDLVERMARAEVER